MTKIFVDTKFLLDFLITERSESGKTRKIMERIVKDDIRAYISPLSLVEVFDVLKEQKSVLERKELIENLLEVFEVVDLDKDVLRFSLYSPTEDFEEALQHTCAKKSDAEYILMKPDNATEHDTNIEYLSLDMLIDMLG